MKRRLLAMAAGIAALAIVTAGPALAIIPGTEDQHQDNTGGTTAAITGASQMEAQLFTAGLTGNLVAIQLYVNGIDAAPGVAAPNQVDGVTVSIHNVVSGHPDSPSLGNWGGTVSAGTWNTFVLGTAIAVTSGTQYAIVITPDSSQVLTLGGSCTAGDYTGGGAQVYNGSWMTPHTYDTDSCIEHFAFRTYVTTSTPPPTTAVASSSSESNGTALPLLLAGAFAVIAYVTVRRFGLARR